MEEPTIPCTPLQLLGRLAPWANEIPGEEHNPLILFMFQRCAAWIKTDEDAWCSVCASLICGLLGLDDTRSPAARSWLRVGIHIPLEDARPNDLVILKRGFGPQPGPEVINAPGHVTFWLRREEGKYFTGRGGNQRNTICDLRFSTDLILDIRRLY